MLASSTLGSSSLPVLKKATQSGSFAILAMRLFFFLLLLVGKLEEVLLEGTKLVLIIRGDWLIGNELLQLISGKLQIWMRLLPHCRDARLIDLELILVAVACFEKKQPRVDPLPS